MRLRTRWLTLALVPAAAIAVPAATSMVATSATTDDAPSAVVATPSPPQSSADVKEEPLEVRVAAEETRKPSLSEQTKAAQEAELKKLLAARPQMTASEEAVAKAKAASEAAQAKKKEEARTLTASSTTGADQTNVGLARTLAAKKGWVGEEWTCLSNLWMRESGFNHTATNPSSAAYGIPQSLPGTKMASAGADWKTNPVTQITWGLGYIKDRYKTPCAAWAHSEAVNWY